MRVSRILQKLRGGDYVLVPSVWTVPHWKIVDMMGVVGFDGVWLENEHGDFSLGELPQMTLAGRGHGMGGIVRISLTGYTSFISPLEAVASGLIIPHCMGAEDARSIVHDAKFAPLGMRGVGGGTDADYGSVGWMDYATHANRETFIIVMIEDQEAVEEVDAIAAIDGIDILFVGPGDLSQSYGVLGQWEHPLIHRTMDATAIACAKYGKWWGTVVNSPEHGQQLLARGARFLSYGSDQGALMSGFRQIKEEMEGMKIL